MSDCRNGGRNVYRIPEDREPGVLYDHGQPNYDYLQARAIVVGGVRFERVRTCHVVTEYVEANGEWFTEYSCGCSVSGFGHNFCSHCGAKVVSADD
jgi:hypothetical protein